MGNKTKYISKRLKGNKSSKAMRIVWSMRKRLAMNDHTGFTADANNRTSLKVMEHLSNDDVLAIASTSSNNVGPVQHDRNLYTQIKTEVEEEMEFKLEDLSHSVDIKEETLILDCQPEEPSQIHSSCEILEETPSHSNSCYQIKTEEDEIEFKLKHLPYFIDINEETSFLQYEPEETNRIQLPCDVPDETQCLSNSYSEIKIEEIEDLHDIIEIKEETEPDTTCESVVRKRREFSCATCGYTCLQQGTLKRHLRTHTGEKPYECEICDYKSADRETLKCHLRSHTGEKPYTCEFCNLNCARKETLKYHLRTHTGEKPFTCEICGYRSAQRGSLTIHLRSHSGEKLFKCEMCDYKSAHKGNYKTHVRTHTGEAPFQCEICGYKCSLKESLNVHIRTHTGEKPFTCKICNYKSKQRAAMNRHIKMHMGIKPFKCEICEYKCAYRGSLRSHLRIHK